MGINPGSLDPALKENEFHLGREHHFPWPQVLPALSVSTMPSSTPPPLPSGTEEKQKFDVQRLRTKADCKNEKVRGPCGIVIIAFLY